MSQDSPSSRPIPQPPRPGPTPSPHSDDDLQEIIAQRRDHWDRRLEMVEECDLDERSVHLAQMHDDLAAWLRQTED